MFINYTLHISHYKNLYELSTNDAYICSLLGFLGFIKHIQKSCKLLNSEIINVRRIEMCLATNDFLFIYVYIYIYRSSLVSAAVTYK